MKTSLSVLLAFSLILSLFAFPAAAETASSVYVQKVENLPADFIFGMDVSSVLAEEASGVKYYDFDGREADLFQILANNGINYIRVRVWNNPYDDEGHGFGGGNCDISTAVEIGKRATACGMRLLVDFHYSDFWADPGKQMVPRAWQSMGIRTKKTALYQFTRDCLLRLKEAGVDVGMVQLGNETTGAMCGETGWKNITQLMDAGARACREVFPDALIALHFTDPQDPGRLLSFAKEIDAYEQRGMIDYDVFAVSYYPYWHGSLDNLAAVLTEVAETYGKKVMVMETAYPYTPEDTDFSGNSVSGDSPVDRPYPFTVQGQASSLRDITDTVVNRTPAGIGVCWWEGAWITVGTRSPEENREKWEKYGSGWAASYAGVYDPDDAGQYYGGSSWDNQAFFGPDGKPLESLKVFKMMREGNETEARIDALEPARVTCSAGGPLSLPGTVGAKMTDGSVRDVPVTWDVTEEELARMSASGPARYTVTGRAEGLEAECLITVEAANCLADPGFEENSGAWVFTNLGQTQELYVEEKPQDSLDGTRHAHFWSAAQDSVEFTLEQEVRDLPEGNFRFSVSVMGGDCGETDIYAYVKVDGQEVARSEQIPIRGWKNWTEGLVPVFRHPAGSAVTVGVYVKCRGTGNGAWGKIDGAMLVSVP